MNATPDEAMRIRVHYPAANGRIEIRSEPDWTGAIEPVREDRDRHCYEFELPVDRPYRYFKPVLRENGHMLWSAGDNCLALASAAHPVDVYPHFHEDNSCSACELRELADHSTGRHHAFRVFCPPGYHGNTLRRYPVLYMQDGQNLFFPDEAFQGHHWRISETLGVLDTMNAAAQVIVVGIYPKEREKDYTQPGYDDYGRFLVDTLKPFIDREYRTLSQPEHTGVMGSSLGGVVSFYLAWQYPQVFGMAACMSSTFGWRDDLLIRVDRDERPDIRLYLDSGWPRDNYEVTREMWQRLLKRGFGDGTDLFYLAFPEAMHNEAHWAMRTHIPFQWFFGGPPAPADAAHEVKM